MNLPDNRYKYYSVASHLSEMFDAYVRSGNADIRATIEWIEKQFLPSGSGIDCGTKFDWDESKPERLVFNLDFHHMNQDGYYDGWTEHTAVVTPTLASPGFQIKITGKNRNDIKDYLHEVLSEALRSPCRRLDTEGGTGYSYGWLFGWPPRWVEASRA